MHLGSKHWAKFFSHNLLPAAHQPTADVSFQGLNMHKLSVMESKDIMQFERLCRHLPVRSFINLNSILLLHNKKTDYAFAFTCAAEGDC